MKNRKRDIQQIIAMPFFMARVALNRIGSFFDTSFVFQDPQFELDMNDPEKKEEILKFIFSEEKETTIGEGSEETRFEKV